MEHTSHKSDTCLNCGYLFHDEDNFCPRCGQANHSLKVPFRHLVMEFIESTLHIDTKLFTTFFSLILKPGLLTEEFNKGRRMKFLPPIRIYIFISFVFFLLLSFNSGHDSETGKKEKRGFGFAIGKGESSEKLKGLNRTQVDSIIKANNVQMTKFNKFIMEQSFKIENGPKGAFTHLLVKGISYLMFFLMPLFGLLVMLFHLKRKGFYTEYLIYSIHFHSFVFLTSIFYILLSYLLHPGYLMIALALIIPLYLFLSLRAAFPQTNGKALIKTVSISVIYFFLMSIFLVITVLISVFIF